jgi:hypothetical protein
VLTKEQRTILSEVPAHGAWMTEMLERQYLRPRPETQEGAPAKEGESEKHEH